MTETLRPSHDCLVVESVNKPWTEQVSARFLVGDQAQLTLAHQLVQRVKEQKRAKDEGDQDWQATSVACHSLKFARALEERLREECGLTSTEIRFYHGHSDGKAKRRDFANATEAWGDGTLVVVTGLPSLASSLVSGWCDSECTPALCARCKSDLDRDDFGRRLLLRAPVYAPLRFLYRHPSSGGQASRPDVLSVRSPPSHDT